MWEAGTKVRVKPGTIDRTVERRLSYEKIYTIAGIYELRPGQGQFNNYVKLVADDLGESIIPWDPERRFELVEPEIVMVRSGYYISRGVEYKIEGIEGNATDAWISGPGTPRQLYTYFADRIGDEHMGGLIKYKFVRPLEEQAEPVYVYVAYCKGVRGNTFTYSHTGEFIFNEHLAQIERQGATVVAKKRIKFNIN